MLFAIDVGNTNIKFAFFDGEELIRVYRVPTDSVESEIAGKLLEAMDSDGLKKEEVTGAIISLVVPRLLEPLMELCQIHFSVIPMFVRPGIETGIKLIETDPYEIGADRVADGAGALAVYGGPIIVADYGTATKFDLFTEDGSLFSAVTCPGVKLCAKTLWEGTALLPQFEIEDPGSIICRHTLPSLQAGMFYSKLGEAECIINRLKAEYGKETKVVVTGGLGSIFYGKSPVFDYYDRDLTLTGLRVLYGKNK